MNFQFLIATHHTYLNFFKIFIFLFFIPAKLIEFYLPFIHHILVMEKKEKKKKKMRGVLDAKLNYSS